MDSLKQRISAELENINALITEIPATERLPYLTLLELAGVATLIHNFYNGIENILKQILSTNDIKITEGKSWHKDLLDLSLQENIITSECRESLGLYLAFRHYFSHGYALDLYHEKMEPLVDLLPETYAIFKKNINKFY